MLRTPPYLLRKITERFSHRDAYPLKARLELAPQNPKDTPKNKATGGFPEGRSIILE